MDDLDPDDIKWAQQTGQQLREQEDVVAQAVQARLRTARNQALQATPKAATPWILWPALSAGGACAAILAWAVLIATPVDILPVMDDVEMAAAQEVELLEELEFVAWMLAMEESNATPSQG